jgi:activator of HSP90 ATPase
MNDVHDRRPTGGRNARRQWIIGTTAALGSLSLRAAGAATEERLSGTAETIHHVTVFKADRRRVYDALIDTARFDAVTRLSAAGMRRGAKPTQIGPAPGDPFVLFGGYISGRHIELVPGKRIVQAWRTGRWDPGAYSIVRFDLEDQGANTRLVFEHSAFPAGESASLARGWKENYWEPLEKYLAGAA